MKVEMNRRTFLGGAAAGAAFTIVPHSVLGGAGNVPPSEKITFAYVGCGTQGLREMMGMLAQPEVQIVAVCDPERDGANYVDWSRDGLRNEIARALGKPEWRKGGPIPGGRDVAREIVELYYAKERASDKFKGCATFVDFRELLEKAQGIDAVKVMTPDHLHATVAVAAMKKGKHVMMHKPLANRLQEARLVVETARKTKVGTHFLPASAGENVRMVAGWIRAGAIGTLREIHNWSYRPVWPQYAMLPKDTPPVPKDFDWDLWLGPSLPRPYHPHYTHAVFRGWYEFGGGSIADMGHYSLWPVFREFALDNLAVVESTPSHVCTVENGVCSKIRNDFAFPYACTIRFKFPAQADRPAVDLFWYDGSMRPPTPPEVEEDNKELESEGMMFVGDQGKILGGFRCENPRIIPQRRARELGKGAAKPESQERGRGRGMRDAAWVKTFQGGAPTYGDFTLGGPISDAFNLGAISLRLGGKRLVWDGVKITNLPAANKYLTREYRQGWELKA